MSEIKTSNVTSTQGLSLRPGPHDDLRSLCLCLEEFEIPNEKAQQPELALLANSAKVLLEAESIEERLDAAKAALEKRSDCSIANAVIAREGSHNEDEANGYYQLAIAALKQESTRHRELAYAHFKSCPDSKNGMPCHHKNQDIIDEPYLLKSEAYYLIASEFALFLWTQEKFDHAIEIMFDVISEMKKYRHEDEHRYVSEGLLVTLTYAWLVLQNRESAATPLLSNANNSPAWHYSNALRLYRSEGDTRASRGALLHALKKYFGLFETLTGFPVDQRKPKPSGEYRNQNREEHPNNDASINFLKLAWQKSSGSIEWAINCEKLSVERLPEFDRYTSSAENAERIKRWKNNLSTGITFIKRSSQKDARKFFKMALKETVAMKNDEKPFLITFALALELSDVVNFSKEELFEPLKKMAISLEDLLVGTPQHKAGVYQVFGQFFEPFDANVYAADMYKLALRHLENIPAENSDYLNLYVSANTEFSLARQLGSQAQYQEALEAFERALAMKEQYLPFDHPHLAKTLDLQSRCLHHLGRHKEEKEMRQRLLTIDRASAFDEHEAHGSSCPWYLSPCPQDSVHA